MSALDHAAPRMSGVVQPGGKLPSMGLVRELTIDTHTRSRAVV